MKLFSRRSTLVAILAIIGLQSQLVRSNQTLIPATTAVGGMGEKHPVIHRAIRALEAAKAYMEGASHDFCGHRVAALAESNLALNELGLAVICDKRRDKSVGSIALPTQSASSSCVRFAPDRHPLIRQAIDALQAARRDLQSDSQVYCGHRILALEAVERALTQLKLANDCDMGQTSSV